MFIKILYFNYAVGKHVNSFDIFYFRFVNLIRDIFVKGIF